MDLIAGIDWGWLAAAAWSTGWPVVVAIPGFIAFAWQWMDRSDRLKADRPHGILAIAREPIVDDWFEATMSIKNRWDERVFGRHVRVKGVKGALIAKPHESRGQKLPDFETAATDFPVDWTFRSSVETGENPWSGQTLIFVKLPGFSRSSTYQDFPDGSVQSGTGGETRLKPSIDRLSFAVHLISSSKRRARVTLLPTWNSKRANPRSSASTGRT